MKLIKIDEYYINLDHLEIIKNTTDLMGRGSLLCFAGESLIKICNRSADEVMAEINTKLADNNLKEVLGALRVCRDTLKEMPARSEELEIAYNVAQYELDKYDMR